MNQTHPPELPALTATPRFGWRQQPAAWLAAGAVLAVLLLAGLMWHGSGRLDDTRQELARRLADSDSLLRETQASAKQDRVALDALQAKVGALEARLAEMQSQQLALDAMYQELSRSRDDRLVAEIEQAVAIAAQQLQLAGNVEAALIALSGAEARLAKNAQPQFLSLRRLIARDIERLKALPGADVSGIALRLDSILNAVSSLPLASDHRPTESKAEKKSKTADGAPAVAPTPSFQQMLLAWLGEFWGEMRQLVRIERIDRPDPGLLAPREIFFLRENLRLRLLSARLALLARDGRSFRGDIEQSSLWLNAYFDVRTPAVQEALATLRNLGRLDVVRESAELNETLSALRNFKLTGDRRDRGPAR